MTDNGLPSWTAPSGRTYPPPPRSFTPPILPTTFTAYDGEDDDEPYPVADHTGPQESGSGIDGAGDGSTPHPRQEPDEDRDTEPSWLHSPQNPVSDEEAGQDEYPPDEQKS
jgi:hypothetical protein